MYEVGGANVGEWTGNASASDEGSERELLQVLDVRVSGLGLPTVCDGVLVVTTERILWWSARSESDDGAGLSLPLADVVLHAISRDPAADVAPRIYAQICDGEEDIDFFPSQPDSDLQRIFQAICEAIEMRGPVDEGDIDLADDVYTGAPTPNPVLSRLDSILEVPEHLANGSPKTGDQGVQESVREDLSDLRFEDAEEPERES